MRDTCDGIKEYTGGTRNGGIRMDEKRQLASHANLQIKRLERELEETTDQAKKEKIQKEIDELRKSIS
jgi:hypothetical protein